MADETQSREELLEELARLRERLQHLERGAGQGGRPSGSPSASIPGFEDLALTLFELTPDAAAISSLDGRFSLVNQAFLRVFGFAGAEGLYREFPQFADLVMPEDRHLFVESGRRLEERGGAIHGLVARLRRRDGTVFAAEFSTTLLRDRSGQPQAFLSLLRDVTHFQKTQEDLTVRRRQVEALYHVSEAARTAPDLETFLRSVVQEVAASTGFPIVSLERYDEARQEMIYLANCGLGEWAGGALRAVPTTRTLSGVVATTGKSLAVDDARTRPEYADEGLRRLEVTEFYCVPISRQKRVWGVLALANQKGGRLAEDPIPWLETLAGSVGVQLERREMLDALREREALLHEAQQIARLGHYVFDVPRDRWAASPTLDEILGLDPALLHDFETWTGILHPDDRAEMVRYFQQNVAGKREPFDREYRIIRRSDGVTRWVHGLGRLSFDEGGTLLRMVGTIQDITERHEAEQAVHESERRFRTLFEHAAEGILVADLETRRFRFANRAICRMFGYTLEEMCQLRVDDAHPPEDLPRVIAEFEAQARSEKVVAQDLPCRRKDGSVFQADIATTTIKIEGRLCNVGFFTDVTERRILEQERLDMERRLLHSQKLESLGLLAGGIAHDFNNLLMAVIGHANLARRRLTADHRACENVQQIEQAAVKAADLARQLLAYSGRGRFVLEPLDLSRVVKEMTPLLAVSIAKKANLVQHLAAGLPAVEADPTQVRQIVMNLVINASEALGDQVGVINLTTGCHDCPADYLRGSWTTDPLPPGLYVFLEVSDTGCGMDEATRARVFDPFFTTKFTGRGLGMAAVLGIVRGHHGGIKVYSEPGKGTTFKILLPASRQAIVAATPPPGEEAWRGAGTVLLVDDEEEIRAVGRAMLEELGFQVVTAGDGREGIAVFRSLVPRPTVVLLDLTMPACDGEEAFRELRHLEPDVQVVMMSGFNEQEVSQKFTGRRLAGFVQKPFSLADLRQTLRRALAGG